MRILLALFALLLCIQRSQAGQFGKLFNSALALHKKRSADKGGAIGNIAHSKTKKIKVAPARPDNTKKDATKETSDGVKAATSATAEKVSVDNDEAIAKKQTAFNNGQQMTTSILTMLLSRMIFKLDYKNKRIVLLCRIAFCAYIVLSQLLFWFLKHQVNARDDQTILTKSSADPMQGLMKLAGAKLSSSGPQGGLIGSLLALSGATSGASGGDSPTMTVKQHDLEEIRKLSSSMLFELLAAFYMHFVNKNYAPLLMIPLMGLTNKLKAPIVQLHVLRMRAVGPLARPFKSPMEAMLASVSGAAAAANRLSAQSESAQGADASDANESPSAVVDVASVADIEAATPLSAADNKKLSKNHKHKVTKGTGGVTHKNSSTKKAMSAQSHTTSSSTQASASTAATGGEPVSGKTTTDSVDTSNVYDGDAVDCEDDFADLVEEEDDVGDLLGAIDKLGE